MEITPEDIENLVKRFHAVIANTLPVFEKDAKEIIASQSTDQEDIELTLDNLLEGTYIGLGDEAFVKLVDYYKTLNPERAMYFWNLYDTGEEAL